MTDSFSQTLELLRRAKAGDEECLGSVLERYRQRLLLRIRLMMGNRARAVAESSDFLHDVFATALDEFEHFELRDERAFLRWLTTMARNRIRMEVRRRREVVLESMTTMSGALPPDSLDGSPLSAVERLEQVTRLVDVLAELDETHRRIVELRHFEGLSFAEIGRALGRSENAVQLLHARIVLKLGQELSAD